MGYGTVTTSRTGAVLTASINNAPINLCDWKFMSDFDGILTSITADSEVKILVVQSDVRDFFVAHLDLLPRPGKHQTNASFELCLMKQSRV
jgi:enoyl-CoA hydratase/carnithine racemase